MIRVDLDKETVTAASIYVFNVGTLPDLPVLEIVAIIWHCHYCVGYLRGMRPDPV